jgi:hypothetical protein
MVKIITFIYKYIYIIYSGSSVKFKLYYMANSFSLYPLIDSSYSRELYIIVYSLNIYK